MVTTANGTHIIFNDGTTQSTAVQILDSGTLSVFYQAAAPTGWTKQTAHNDKTLRVVNGTAGSGGSVAFSTAFSSRSVDATTLSTTQIPSHQHGNQMQVFWNSYSRFASGNQWGYLYNRNVAAAGGGGSHNHSINLAVNYVDVIIASKN